MAENSRRHKRFKTNYLIKYRLLGSNNEFVSNLKDLSASGVRFWSEIFVPESALLHISFFIPPLDRTFETRARVVRTRAWEEPRQTAPLYYVAAGFLDLSADDQLRLNDFIEGLADDRHGRALIDHHDKVRRFMPEILRNV